MLKFRLYIFRDPDAKDRGYSLKGIKVPLTTWCPESPPRGLQTYDEKPALGGPVVDYWKVPVCLLILAKPELARHLKGLTHLYVPTPWCDVAPVDRWEDM